MWKSKWVDARATAAVDRVRYALASHGCRSLAETEDTGLGTFQRFQVWSAPDGRVFYLAYGWDGSWDILTPVADTIDAEATLDALRVWATAPSETEGVAS